MSMLSNDDKDNEFSLENCFRSTSRCHLKKSNYLIHFWQTWHQKAIQISEKELLSYEQIHSKKRSFEIIGSEIIFSIQTTEALLLFPCIPKRSSGFNQNDMKSDKIEMVPFTKNLDIDKVLAQKICKDIMSWKTIDNLKHSYFNKISFIDNNAIKYHLKEILSKEEKQKLFTFVLFSRESKEILQASSNSISILNATDFSFTNRDLSNISIPKADLSWNNWIRVNFTNSDLSKVNFTGSNLNNCNFQNSIMTNVKFGFLYPNNPHSKPISIFTFSHHKHIIASWSLDKTIKIWNFKSHEVLHTLKEVQNVTCFQFSPHDKILAFGGEEGIYLWYIGKNYVRCYESSEEYIIQILFSKNDKHIIYSSESRKEEWKDHYQNTWHRETLKTEHKIAIIDIEELKEVSKASNKTYCMSISNCGKLLICAGDFEILLFDLKLNLLEKYKCGFQVKYIAFLPKSNSFISYGELKIYLWNLKDKKSINQIRYLDVDIRSFIASEDCLNFAFDTRFDNTLSIFQAETQKIAFRSASHLQFIEQPTFSNVSNHIGVLFRNEGIKIWKLNYQNPSNLIEHRSKITQISVSPCGKYFASASIDGKIKIWSLYNFHLIKTLLGHKSIVYTIVFSPIKDILISSSYDGTLKIWSMNTFKIISKFTKEWCVNSLDFSSSGIYLAGIRNYIPGVLNTIYIWNFEEGTRNDICNCQGYNKPPKIYFLKNEDYVIFNDNAACQILDWRKNDIKYRFIGNWEAISLPACRTQLALADEYGQIELWELFKNKEILDPHKIAYINGHKRNIIALCFSPSGKYLVSGAIDGVIKLWEIKPENKEINQIEKIGFGNSGVSALTFSMCGRFIISGFESGCVRVWGFDKNDN